MRIGDKFSSFVELQAAIEKYSNENFVNFSVRSSSRLDNRKNLSEDHFVSQASKELVYYFINFKCIKSEHYISTAKVRKMKTLKQGCKAAIRLKLSKCSRYLQVMALNEDHNHSSSEEEFKSFSKQRNKIGDEMKALCTAGVPSKELVERIRKETGRLITSKDINNIKKRKRDSGKSITNDNQSKLESLIKIEPENYEEIEIEDLLRIKTEDISIDEIISESQFKTLEGILKDENSQKVKIEPVELVENPERVENTQKLSEWDVEVKNEPEIFTEEEYYIEESIKYPKAVLQFYRALENSLKKTN